MTVGGREDHRSDGDDEGRRISKRRRRRRRGCTRTVGGKTKWKVEEERR